MRSFASFAAALLVTCSACQRGQPAQPPLRVAAASDLSMALTEVAQAFAREAGVAPQLTFGSSGLLSRQLAEGAPFDLFLSANVDFADQAARSGACDPATKALYARGRIVIWTASTAQAPQSIRELAGAGFRKVAIANPEHAPYGRAALQALERAGVRAQVQPKLVFGENVQQALQFASTGNADAAIVALALAHGTGSGKAVPVDASTHDPIDQALVVCTRGQNRAAAGKLAALITSARGRAILARHGFDAPAPAQAGR